MQVNCKEVEGNKGIPVNHSTWPNPFKSLVVQFPGGIAAELPPPLTPPSALRRAFTVGGDCWKSFAGREREKRSLESVSPLHLRHQEEGDSRSALGSQIHYPISPSALGILSISWGT